MNPLLSRDFRIPFDKIKPEHIEPGIQEALAQAQKDLDKLTALPGVRTYENTVQALDILEERLDRAVGLAYHLTSVVSSPELRTAYNAVLPEFSAFYAKLPLNDALWRALKEYSETSEAAALTGIRKRHLDKLVQSFVRAGADLPTDEKSRAEAIKIELSQLHTKFAENVLDATNVFELIVTDEAELSGLPDSALRQAKASAEAKGASGYRFTLQAPSLVPFLQYADNRELRQKLQSAYVSRASGGEIDNRPLLERILALRRELAQLMGYKDFADYRLEVNMVKTGDAAVRFERELFEKTEPFWREEVTELTEFARTLGIDNLQPWDTSYVAEKLRQSKYDLDAEALRPYFPVDRVLQGLFEIAERIFGVTVTERDIEEVWHSEVKFYDIHGENGVHLGSFYADWFPRESKNGGAWMNSFITGGPRRADNEEGDEEFEPHLGLMVGNFSPPQAGKPALLTHREVETTFHEFGHLLHHCLSRVEIPARAGTNVSRDWVELPSQMMENWTWERGALDLFARHYETGEPLPDELFQKMQAARTFMAANAQMRQLSFGTVDLSLHIDYEPGTGSDAVSFGQKVMEPFSIKPEFAHNSFLTGFTHVFTGSYAAGYYSYKWSEVLDADAFSRFQNEGIFSRETGRDYVNAILARGDSADAAELFREFMGRGPDVGALLRRNLGREKVAATD